MAESAPAATELSALIVGASRGLGHAMAAEFAARNWRVVGTVRGEATPLHDLASERPRTVEVARLDITDHAQIGVLRDRLSGRGFEIVFVNAGIANRRTADTLAEVSVKEFAEVMAVNVLGVMRAIEAFGSLVREGGVIGAMSSGQGSIANNGNGTNDVYRASKAALNQAMSSYAGRHRSENRAIILLAPGWVRTDLGGPQAPFGVEETVPLLVDLLIAQQGKPGLRFLDRQGQAVPW